MLYGTFERAYLKMKEDIEAQNRLRLEQETLPSGVIKNTWDYWGDQDSMHLCNIYQTSGRPQGEKRPLIVDIHGGGWLCGDKDINDNFAYHLALTGSDVISLSYRTIDTCTITEQIRDIFAYLHF